MAVKIKKMDFWKKIKTPQELKGKLAIVADDSKSHLERDHAASYIRGVAGYYRQTKRKPLSMFVLGELKKAISRV